MQLILCKVHIKPLWIIPRLPTLAANRLPYFLMILTTTCALLTKRSSAHLHTLRFPLPMKFTNTWESLKPSSSVPRVRLLNVSVHIWHICLISLFIYYLFVCLPKIQSTAERSATQMYLSLRTFTQLEKSYCLALMYYGQVRPTQFPVNWLTYSNCCCWAWSHICKTCWHFSPSAGPKVVSKDITVESIEEVSKIIKRAPVIWDNIHANDYDQKRLFLGPYKGRSTELIPRLKGVLTNPNCEFESNFIAIHTLATWYKSNMNGVRKDVVMSKYDWNVWEFAVIWWGYSALCFYEVMLRHFFYFSNVSPSCPLPADGEDSTVSIQIKLENEGSDEELETDMLYSPQLALKLALTEWLGEFGVPHQYNSKNRPINVLYSTINGVPGSIAEDKLMLWTA